MFAGLQHLFYNQKAIQYNRSQDPLTIQHYSFNMTDQDGRQKCTSTQEICILLFCYIL